MLIVLVGLVVAIGAVVQGVVGFGMALVATPLLALLDPALVPVPLLLLSSVHSVLTLGREHRQADWPGVGWAMIGRLAGTAVGVYAVTQLSSSSLAVVIGVSVLICVGLSLLAWKPRPAPRSLVVAGAAGGATGTAAGIGGPPLALLYQHADGPRLRATMGAYFVVGSVTSVAALAIAGAVTASALQSAAILLPFMLGGFLLSGPARRVLDGGWIRPAVLAISGVSAVVLLAKALI
ncbi:MAG: sulfite transporter TauE/SafE [Pseudonocardia sp.]|nr:sulfite transporter TauE/SafE [Pseudonocardia sp.]